MLALTILSLRYQSQLSEDVESAVGYKGAESVAGCILLKLTREMGGVV